MVTISDTRGEKEDTAGLALIECLREIGAEVLERVIVTDDHDEIVGALKTAVANQGVNLVMTTGGTGFAPRDNTPEATLAVIERETPGISEAIRAESLKITPLAMLSRAVSGISGRCLIINLPGSPKAVRECFAAIKKVLPHAVDLLEGYANH